MRIRYVVVIRYVSYGAQLPPIRFTWRNLECISKSTIKETAKIGLKVRFSYGYYEKCMIVGFLAIYIGPPNSECGVVHKIWWHNPVSIENVSLWYLFFDPPKPQSNQIWVSNSEKVTE